MNTLDLMKVEDVVKNEKQIKVITTGAVFTFHLDEQGRIECWQRINKERKNSTVRLNVTFKELTVEEFNDERVILHAIPNGKNRSCSCIVFNINRDSCIEMFSMSPVSIKAESFFSTEYYANKGGNYIMADKIGGFGLYTKREDNDTESVSKSDGRYSLTVNVKGNNYVYMSVFPPRKFNKKQYYNDKIYHWYNVAEDNQKSVSPYDIKDTLKKASKYTNVLTIHESLWKGKITRKGGEVKTTEDVYVEGAYCGLGYDPFDKDEIKEIISRAHSLDMKVVPYFSPYYSIYDGDEYINQLARIKDEYGFDGVYFDGNSFDIKTSYERVKKVRKLIGDGIFYIHCTTDPISSSVFCPFIDTYADYILRAEHITAFDEDYLRYVISSYNLGNSIGLVWHEGYKKEFVKQIADRCIDNKVSMPVSFFDGDKAPVILDLFKNMEKRSEV